MSESKGAVLVAGAQGVIGRAAAEHFSSLPGTKVYGLSRRQPEEIPGIVPIDVDLLSPEDVERANRALERCDPHRLRCVCGEGFAGRTMLLDVVDKNAPGLRHVTLYQGGKAYGADLGPFKTPAREDDPRLMGPNFYYDQEDFIRERQSGRQWHYSVLRPEAVCGFAVGNPI